MASELKPCPFCDNRLDKRYNLTVSRGEVDDRWYVRNWQVECDECGARGGKRKKKEEAIKAWNTRAEEETHER